MVRPEKRIKTDQDVQIFLESRQFAELWAFMLRLNAAVKNEKCSSAPLKNSSTAVRHMVGVLEKLLQWTHDIKPLEQTRGRFGNGAFRTWHSRLRDQARMLIGSVIGREMGEGMEGGIVEELGEYLTGSFGNETRIDYGSGHEGMFLVLLFCLWKVGVFVEDDDLSLVMVVFVKYLEVTRTLQKRYRLEPAGSHGVWGLDDYSFLPFLWGSSQLFNSRRISPGVIGNDEELKVYRNEYLYLDAVWFIKEVKKGAFFEHSPMLWDVSKVEQGWPKINQGMIKMYRGEVWAKRPVIQHFLFGNVFTFPEKEEKRNVGEGGSSACGGLL